MKILVTGGAGFIGSTLVKRALSEGHEVVNIDALTYAGNISSLEEVSQHKDYQFFEINICDTENLERVFYQTNPDVVMHLAAESHVDRSIDNPKQFLHTNIIGTFNLLNVSKGYLSSLEASKKEKFKFHHISTDEVYGDLSSEDPPFNEKHPYDPSSPYSASKASSDHLVRAWQRTYDLPCIITNCSNNYGPFHFPEKLIPHMIINAIKLKPLPVYGDGQQIRDWLYVEDHAEALLNVIKNGKSGEAYNIGGNNEITNLEVVEAICDLLDELLPLNKTELSSYRDLIKFVKDRPGHDRRYAIDSSKIQNELNWSPKETFQTGLKKTVSWYLDNENWYEEILNESYKLERLG